MPTAEPGNRRWLHTAQLLVLGLGVAYTVATLLTARLRVSLFAPDLRTLIEVGGLCFVLFAALTLTLPSEADARPARNAFVSALAVIALSNAVFAVGPVLVEGRLTFEQGLAFYPWVAARYVGGALFIGAGLERPRLRLGPYLALALGVLVLVDVALVAGRLPVPVRIAVQDGSSTVEVVSLGSHVALQAVPGALFALGAWLAGRIYLRSAAPVYLWLSLALLVQVFTQVHEILHPAFLGPIVTSADALRSLAFLLLLVGALLQVRGLYLDRLRVVRDQQGDLRVHEEMVGELTRFAEEEQVFRAIVSHELATPIATIHAFAHVLDTALPEPSSEQIRLAVAGIRAESRRLAELVARMDELRDLELAEFRCELRPVRVQPLLEDAVSFVNALPGDHPVTLRCSDARVHADPVRLGQAVRNVLTNSARYAPPTSPIFIQGTMHDGERYRISISDRGPGVPPDERERVLRRYARGSSGRAKKGGGLGLYLASRIIDAHHGNLKIEDVDGPGSGTRVVVDLRLAT